MQFRWLDEIALAPDGRHVAYTLRHPHVETNGYTPHVYLRDLASAAVQSLTSGASTASALAWSRDGAQLAYSYSEGGVNSVRVWSEDGTRTLPGRRGRVHGHRLVARWSALQAGWQRLGTRPLHPDQDTRTRHW